VSKSPTGQRILTFIRRINAQIANYFGEVKIYLEVTRAHKIFRRYFTINAFDGAMTSLGVIIGTYIAGITDCLNIIHVIFASGIAMTISGFSGTYMTESAERNSSLNDLEDAMLSNLENTIHGEASRLVSLFAAIIDGLAPFLASLPSILPFALVPLGIIPLQVAFFAAVGTSIATLFLLGVFLGRISGSNLVYSGIKTAIAGVAVTIIVLLL
jgi:predicted membrane protein (TIGR00267 family)